MTDAERDAFLQQLDPAWVAAVATLDARGSPHTVPVWYRWDGRAFHLWSTLDLAWPNNLRRDPRLSLVVFEHLPPLRAVYAKGTATLRTGSVSDLRDHILPIVERYEADPEATIERYAGPEQVAVTVVPSSIAARAND